MQQLQFVLNNLSHAEAIQRSLTDNGIAQSQLKFFSRDKGTLSGLNVSAADFWDERDIPHMMLRGALLGLLLACGIILALNFLAPALGALSYTLIAILLTMFGTWLGGLIGFNNENYKLAGHHSELLHGEAILVITARREQTRIINKTMGNFQADIHHTDYTESGINPLKGWQMVHHPDD